MRMSFRSSKMRLASLVMMMLDLVLILAHTPGPRSPSFPWRNWGPDTKTSAARSPCCGIDALHPALQTRRLPPAAGAALALRKLLPLLPAQRLRAHTDGCAAA